MKNILKNIWKFRWLKAEALWSFRCWLTRRHWYRNVMAGWDPACGAESVSVVFFETCRCGAERTQAVAGKGA